MTTLHASIFGYETALVDLIGTRGYRTHVFPEIVNVIKTLKDDNENILEVFGAKTPLEAMQKWMTVMEKAKVVTSSASVYEENGHIAIDIPDCTMSHPIHEVMGQKKGICPLFSFLKDLEPV